MKKHLLSLLALLSLLTVLALPSFAAASNTDFSKALPISTNGISTRLTVEEDQSYYYTFTIPSSGSIKLTAGGSVERIGYCIYDSSQKRYNGSYIGCTYSAGSSYAEDTIWLNKGTYYLVAEESPFSAPGQVGTVEIRLKYTSSNETIAEPTGGSNNNIGSASTASLGKAYTGQISTDDGVDYYRFTLPSSGRVKYSFNNSFDGGCYSLSPAAAPGEELWGVWRADLGALGWATLDGTWDLTEGSYYLAIKSDYSDAANNGCGQYNFTLSFTSAGESFRETHGGTNNTMGQASTISLGKTYTGQLAINDIQDFYRFTVSQTANIVFQSSQPIKDTWIEYFLYDANGRQVADWLSQGNPLRERADLKAGTYYLMVKAYELYRSRDTGGYTFSVSVPKILKTPSISKVENVAAGVKLTWGAVSGAKKYRVFCKQGSGELQALKDTTARTFTWKEAAPGVSYTFYVRCLDVDGEYSSAQSAGKSITYLARPLVAAVNVNSNNKDGLRIVASNYDEDALKNSGATLVFKVRKQGTRLWQTVKKLPASQGYSYIWNGAQSGVAYQVNVQAVKGSYKSAEHANGKSIRFYPAPKLVSAKPSGRSIRITWQKGAKAAKYEVLYRYRMYNGNWSSWSRLAIVSGSQTSYVYKYPSSRRYYNFSVRNLDSKNNVLSGYNTVGITARAN